MTTRIDASKRMELLKNRIQYLAGEITDYQSEITALTREHELLEGIMWLYQENEYDPIDEGRKEIFKSEETEWNKQNRGASDEIFFVITRTAYDHKRNPNKNRVSEYYSV